MEEKIKQTITEYEDLVERASIAALEVWYRKNSPKKTTHGIPWDYAQEIVVSNGNLVVTLDTSCCGSCDSIQISIPIEEFLNTNWTIIKEKRLADEFILKAEKEQRDRDRAEKAEKTLYSKLKEKYEPGN